MKVTLKEERIVNGIKRKSGETVEVHDSLADAMVLNGVAVKGEVAAKVQDLSKMTKDELIALASEIGAEVSKYMTKAEIVEVLNGVI